MGAGMQQAIRAPIAFARPPTIFPKATTTELYTLSLHDALPILPNRRPPFPGPPTTGRPARAAGGGGDRKSTRLNSSHANNSYAVFCLKKKQLIFIST